MLEVRGLTVTYGDVVGVRDLDLSVGSGQRLAVLGPSGSGKSTLLRAIAGLELPAAGTISWAGRDLVNVPTHRRSFGLMFQDYALFPHRDVAGNVAFGPQMHGFRRDEVARSVAQALELVGLAGYGHRRITELSGGEQQRVALARALAPRPALLMLDEPLGALDRTLRERLLGDLLELFGRLDLTIIYVTHDQEEALAVGDRVAVLRAGALEALAPPAELWHSPANEFVARFLGFNNIASASVANGIATTPWGNIAVPPGTTPGAHAVLLRPDALLLDPSGAIEGRITSATFRGSRTVVAIDIDAAPSLEVHALPGAAIPAVGQPVRVKLPAEAVLVLPGDHGVTLRQ